MTIGMKIAECRKALGITQSALAEKLDVTNQAVSKWENDQCYPDVTLLPKLAAIFEISIDELFDCGTRETVLPEIHDGKTEEEPAADYGWEDDDAYRIVLFRGHQLIEEQKINKTCTVHLEGEVRDVYCSVNLECGDVGGGVAAEGNVECGNVSGHITAGGYVECGKVDGNVLAGAHVECEDVGGSVSAGAHVECGDVGGSVYAGAQVDHGAAGFGSGAVPPPGPPAPDFQFPFRSFHSFRGKRQQE